MEWLKSMLVEDWQQFYKWWSVRWAALLAASPWIIEQIPPLQQHMSPALYNYLMTFFGIMVVLGRLKQQ